MMEMSGEGSEVIGDSKISTWPATSSGSKATEEA